SPPRRSSDRLRSTNPVCTRSEAFSRPAAQSGYAGQQTTYADPSTWGTGEQGHPGQVDTGRMTIDTVVQKTAASIFLVFVTAALTWWWIGDMTTTDGLGRTVVDETALGQAGLLAMLGAGGAFLLSLVNSFKKMISPALVLGFAAVEGVALGAISKLFDAQFG